MFGVKVSREIAAVHIPPTRCPARTSRAKRALNEGSWANSCRISLTATSVPDSSWAR